MLAVFGLFLCPTTNATALQGVEQLYDGVIDKALMDDMFNNQTEHEFTDDELDHFQGNATAEEDSDQPP